ncbi:hypothetical protein [Methylophilus sp.]|uniref:hypothetical protein n=1 Tax=Methylophilus sp. TaxID=29541 RepID=UPI00403555E5
MKAILPLTALVVVGCAVTPAKYTDRDGNTTEVQAVSMGDREAIQAMREEQLGTSSSVVVYAIPHGTQKDDSLFITHNELAQVAKLVECPPQSTKYPLDTYKSEAKILDMQVLVIANRSNCVIDQAKAKDYLDNAIKHNKQKHFENTDRLQREREIDPRGPYALGCEAYQMHVRGIRDVTTMATAIKLYPKINEAYVKNLYVTGWNDAKVYGARGVDCQYLSASVRR